MNKEDLLELLKEHMTIRGGVTIGEDGMSEVIQIQICFDGEHISTDTFPFEVEYD